MLCDARKIEDRDKLQSQDVCRFLSSVLQRREIVYKESSLIHKIFQVFRFYKQMNELSTTQGNFYTNAGTIALGGRNPKITTDRGNKKDLASFWNADMDITGDYQTEFVVLCRELYP